ncbi:MAG: hypothetical protein U0L05_01315 [Schaedlerella sp.]|nr:hypothetical protein [Schaedlerella sp.]
MRAYQCSRCKHLQDYDEYCACQIGIDPRPNHREKHDAKRCRENFKPLTTEEQWHEKFSWES